MDIFLAYSSRNRKKATAIKKALEREGFTVFVDTTTPTGASWRMHIVDQLKKCKLVIVLWSATSVESRYVIEEAEAANNLGKYFPVMITRCELPYGFASYQARDLLNWSGDLNARKWVDLVDEARDRVACGPIKLPKNRRKK